MVNFRRLRFHLFALLSTICVFKIMIVIVKPPVKSFGQILQPYYKWTYKLDYMFIDDWNNTRFKANFDKKNCNPFVRNAKNFNVNIDGVYYPKILPMYQDKRLNFTCLNENKSQMKTILLWNKFAGVPLKQYEEGIRQPFINHKCPVNNCQLTTKRSLIDQSDFVLFHMRSRIDEFPAIRYSWQRWVYVVYESPQHCPMCHRFRGYFNLSATYKTASDFTSVYLTDAGVKWTSPDEKKVKRAEKNDHLKDKKNLAYAMISSCDAPSKRLEYIKELNRFIDVHVYGKCALDKDKQCDNHGVNCDKTQLSAKYKFYLAFENSICDDYITEKFLNVLYNQEIVPVVLGGAGYENYAPKSAFINVQDFETPAELAKYLMYLNLNRTAYNEYFQWKKWIQPVETVPFQAYLCEMCIKLNLESFTGVKPSQMNNSNQYMKMDHDCKAMKITSLKKFEPVRPLNDKSVGLKMLEIESPHE